MKYVLFSFLMLFGAVGSAKSQWTAKARTVVAVCVSVSGSVAGPALVLVGKRN